jgi:hypothetical protein
MDWENKYIDGNTLDGDEITIEEYPNGCAIYHKEYKTSMTIRSFDDAEMLIYSLQKMIKLQKGKDKKMEKYKCIECGSDLHESEIYTETYRHDNNGCIFQWQNLTEQQAQSLDEKRKELEGV